MGNFSNFHKSAENLPMEDSHILSADLRDPHDNKLNHNTLDLNHCIGSVNGRSPVAVRSARHRSIWDPSLTHWNLTKRQA